MVFLPKLCLMELFFLCAAWSGLGVVYDMWGGDTYLPEVFPRTLGSIYAGENNKWDFSSWIPDVVFINAGTNDNLSHDDDRDARYVNTMVDWVVNMSHVYDAGDETSESKPIFILACGPISDKYCPHIKEVISIVRNISNLEIYYFKQSSSLSCYYHPSVAEHSSLAYSASIFIQQILDGKFDPTSTPTNLPTIQPSAYPTGYPSSQPSQPTSYPSSSPSSMPSFEPTATETPTVHPGNVLPTSTPSAMMDVLPSGQPSLQPSLEPTEVFSNNNSSESTTNPSPQPTSLPSPSPTLLPTATANYTTPSDDLSDALARLARARRVSEYIIFGGVVVAVTFCYLSKSEGDLPDNNTNDPAPVSNPLAAGPGGHFTIYSDDDDEEFEL